MHSTDTHGTNHFNFALLHASGYRFAPRYLNVQRQVKAGPLGLRHPTHDDKDWPSRPNRRVREGLILSEEANIERILLSLALKSTTQSVIVGQRSCLSAQEPLETGAVGARQHHQHPLPARPHRFPGAATQRPAGAQPR